MTIVGIEKLSLVDYPGMLAAVFFTPGCSLNCFYCHNRGLLMAREAKTWMGAEVALAWLDERKGFLDAVVITGGEPTLQPDLADFVRTVRSKGYLTKLDTNGTNPEVVAGLIDEGLLDYVAMDVKAPPGRYAEVCGAHVDLGAIETSIRLLLDGPIDYEFRTTVVPQLAEADIVAIAQWIRGARRYVLQQFRPPQGSAAFFDPRNTAPPHPPHWPEQVLPAIQPFVAVCESRGFDAIERTTKAPIPPSSAKLSA